MELKGLKNRKYVLNTGKLPGFEGGFIPPSYEEIFGLKRNPADLDGDGRVTPWEEMKHNGYLDDPKYATEKNKIAPIMYTPDLDKQMLPKSGPIWDSGTKELINKKKSIDYGSLAEGVSGVIQSVVQGLNDYATDSEILGSRKSSISYVGNIPYERKTINKDVFHHKCGKLPKYSAGTNMLSGATSGAMAGALFGGLGAGIGAVVGGFGTGIAEVISQNKERELRKKYTIFTNNENDANKNSAFGQYIRLNNAKQYGDQANQLLYRFSKGKSENIDVNGFTTKPHILHTVNGIEYGQANAKVEPKEYVTEEMPDGTIIGNRYSDGKSRSNRPGDILYTVTNDRQTIYSNNVDPETGKRYSDEAEERMLLNLPLGDIQQRMEKYSVKGKYNKNAKCGKLPKHEEGWLGNAIPAALGITASLGQLVDAYKNKPYRPNSYSPNPYELEGLTTLAGLRVNPYPIISQLRSAEARTNRAIDIAGGLSGGQRSAARLAALNTTQNNISNLLSNIQQQNNAYKSAYAQAAINAGDASRKARMSANQWDYDMYAKAHAARNRGIQTGIANMLSQIQQYQANEFKRRQFNETMDLYRADQKQRNEYNDWMKNTALNINNNADPIKNPGSQYFNQLSPYEKWMILLNRGIIS